MTDLSTERPSAARAHARTCPLCGSASASVRERRGHYQYVQCSSCRLAFVANPPAESEVLAQYNQGASSKLAYYRMAAVADARSFQRLLARIESHAVRGRLLDVGCNIGTFAKVAAERGWSATGVDVNVEAVQYGRRGGLDLVTMDELLQRGESAQFDVIHSSDTIEHLVDPVAALAPFIEMCKPGGIVVFSTPNYDSLLARVLQLKPTEHVVLFNQLSLRHLLQLLNLNVVELFPFDRYRNLSAMFESTTFDSIPIVKPVFKQLHRVMPQMIMRVAGGENVVVVARKPG